MENLSPEVIEGICDQMDLQTLSRYMATNLKYGTICNRIFKKKKKEDVRSLTGKYIFTSNPGYFSAEDKERIYEKIVENADQDNELYKIKFYYHENPLASIDGNSICNVYFKGNLERAILAAQKYLYDSISKFNMLNYILNADFFRSVDEDGGIDTNSNFRGDEDAYEEFIKTTFNLLISGGIQGSNPGLEEADIEYPQII